MTITSIIISVLLFILFIGLIMIIFTPFYAAPVYHIDDVDETTTTTTTTTTTHVSEPYPDTQTVQTVGDLERWFRDGLGYFVVDPVDKDEVRVAETDQYYEDGAGSVWRLV